ncbi:hypothetical protein JAAARDRAFT_439485 [Jaapia argillacea MUCL 33604]|uniref:C2H2-type domain-containing protein n=1 Tax=Jaapia argillacea MUCL 33604 TaxID=933084 RepID=A0A067PEP1_9AGAM|nr:hypothetical protein JAAARDRAFT_439485 [Jaapia argillacea MUCL 33604]
MFSRASTPDSVDEFFLDAVATDAPTTSRTKSTICSTQHHRNDGPSGHRAQKLPSSCANSRKAGRCSPHHITGHDAARGDHLNPRDESNGPYTPDPSTPCPDITPDSSTHSASPVPHSPLVPQSSLPGDEILSVERTDPASDLPARSHSPYRELKCSRSLISAAEARRKNPANFSCTYCGRTFTRRDNLEVHLRAHKGVYPWTCNICEDKKFLQKSDLTRHLKKVHSFPCGTQNPTSSTQ